MTRNTRNLLLAADFILVLLIVGLYLVSNHINAGSADSKVETAQAGKTSDSTFDPVNAEVLFQRVIDGGFKWQICVQHLPSGKVDILVDSEKTSSFGPGLSMEGLFSPDGQRILFAAGAKDTWKSLKKPYEPFYGEQLDLWVLDIHTRNITRLTGDQLGYYSLRWSPDSKYVSAHAMRGWNTNQDIPPTDSYHPRHDLSVWDVRTKHRSTVVKDVNGMQWMPNSKGLLAITTDWHLYTWTVHNSKLSPVSGNVNQAVWLPDSKGIIYATGEPGLRLTRSTNNTPTVIKHATTNMYSPSWVRDGSQLAYLDGISVGRKTIWNVDILRISDRNIRTLTQLPGGNGTLTWSPNGKQLSIAITAYARGNDPYTTRVYTVDATSGKTKLLHTFQDDTSILGWTQNGKKLIVLNSQYNCIAGITSEPQRIVGISTDTGDIYEIARLYGTGSYTQIHFMDWRFTGKALIGKPLNSLSIKEISR